MMLNWYFPLLSLRVKVGFLRKSAKVDIGWYIGVVVFLNRFRWPLWSFVHFTPNVFIMLGANCSYFNFIGG